MKVPAKAESNRPRHQRRLRVSRVVWRLSAAACVVCLAADVARASILPGPFAFTFFTPALNSLFLLPFQMIGCG